MSAHYNEIRQFMVGVIISLVPLVYLSTAFQKLPTAEKDRSTYPKLIMGLSVFYGLIYVILRKLLPSSRQSNFFLIGAIAGEIYSLVGHFAFHLPERLFHMKHPHLVHLIAPLIYSPLYGFVAYYLENHVLRSCSSPILFPQ